MEQINIIAIVLGILLITIGAVMMNKNYKPIGAFFIILFGLLFILGAAFDPTAAGPKFVMNSLGL